MKKVNFRSLTRFEEGKLVAFRYQILSFLGEGSFGQVYKVLDLITDRIMALKILYNSKSSFSSQIENEFRQIFSFQHPHIVRIYDFGKLDGDKPFLAMEFIEGEPFDRFAQKTSFENVIIASIQTLTALDFVHRQNLLHGDIKPSNILVKMGNESMPHSFLTDFGLARAIDRTDLARFSGTFAYQAPEAFISGKIDHRSEIFSFGITFFEAISGGKLFTSADSLRAFVSSHQELPDLNLEKSPEPIKQILSKCLNKNPQKRYQSAKEMVEDLSVFLNKATYEKITPPEVFLSPPTLANRKNEVALFKERIRDLLKGAGGFIFLYGENGLGKSMLLNEFKALSVLSPIHTFYISLKELTPHPFLLIRKILFLLNNIAQKFAPETLKKFEKTIQIFLQKADFMDSPNSDSKIKDHLAIKENLVEFIDSLFNRQKVKIPLCILIDDLNLADIDSLELIKELFFSRKLSSLLFVATLKPNSGKDSIANHNSKGDLLQELANRAERMEIKSLGLEHSKEMITSILGKDNSSMELVHYLSTRLNGNPLFILEGLKYLYLNKSLEYEKGIWNLSSIPEKAIPLPESLSAISQTVLSSLEKDELILFSLIVISSGYIPEEILRIVCNGQNFALSIKNLLTRQLIEVDRSAGISKYRLLPGFYKETINEFLTSEQIKKYHLLLASAYEQLAGKWSYEYSDTLAIHYQSAGDLVNAAKYLKIAAEKHKSSSAYSSSINFYLKALELLDQIKSSDRELIHLKAIINRDLGNIEYITGNYPKALKFYFISLNFARQSEDNLEISNLLNNIANIFWNQGKRKKAKEFYEESLEYSRRTKDPKIISDRLLNYGNIAYYEGDFQKAKHYYQEAYEFKKGSDDQVGELRVMNNLGAVYTLLGELNEAENLLQQIIPIHRSTGNLRGLAIALHNLAEVHYYQAKFEESSLHYLESAEIMRKIGDKAKLCRTLTYLSRALLKFGEFQKAFAYLDQGVKIAEEIKTPEAFFDIESGLGNFYSVIGKWDKALGHFKKSFRTLKKTENLSLMPELLRSLAISLLFRDKSEKEKEKKRAKNYLIRATTLALKQNNNYEYFSSRIAFISFLVKNGQYLIAHQEINELFNQYNSLSFQELFAELIFYKGLVSLYLDFIDDGLFKILDKALEIAQRSKNLKQLHKLYLLKSNLHLFRNEKEKGIEDLKNAEEVVRYLVNKLPDFVSEMDFRRELVRDFVKTDERDNIKIEKSMGKIANEMEEKKKLEMLLEIISAMNTVSELEELLHLIVKKAVEFTQAERGFLLLYSDKGELEFRVADKISETELMGGKARISYSIAHQALKTATPVCIRDTQMDENFKSRRSIITENLRSVMAVPLISKYEKNKAIGVIYVDSRTVLKPFNDDDLRLFKALADQAVISIENARNRENLRNENIHLRKEVQQKFSFEGIIGKSPEIKNVLALIEKIKDTSSSVLIIGESGTGKELIARCIHYSSKRASYPFLGINCAALTESLLESELFGIERGVATGVQQRQGLFELADKGTLFLDEICDMSLSTQAKVLRVLQEKSFRRVGGKNFIAVDVRIICATNKDIYKEVEKGNFREDLLYRLDVVSIKLPPLRERKEDIPELAEFFLRKHCQLQGRKILGFSEEAMDALMSYSWPGNIRELENQIEKLVNLVEEGRLIQISDLSEKITGGRERAKLLISEERDLKETVEMLEKNMILKVMEKTKWNISQSARKLGLTRVGLKKKLARYNIKIPEQKNN